MVDEDDDGDDVVDDDDDDDVHEIRIVHLLAHLAPARLVTNCALRVLSCQVPSCVLSHGRIIFYVKNADFHLNLT